MTRSMRRRRPAIQPSRILKLHQPAPWLQAKKKGAPTCAGAPRRSGHCRVCAQTVVLGPISCEIVPRENSHIVGALGVLGDVEAFAFGLDTGAQADDDIDDLVEDRRTD